MRDRQMTDKYIKPNAQASFICCSKSQEKPDASKLHVCLPTGQLLVIPVPHLSRAPTVILSRMAERQGKGRRDEIVAWRTLPTLEVFLSGQETDCHRTAARAFGLTSNSRWWLLMRKGSVLH